MGIYAEYLDKKLDFQPLAADRKLQLTGISQLCGNRDVLVFAADLKNNRQPIGIKYSDLLPLNDQLSNLSDHDRTNARRGWYQGRERRSTPAL